MANSEAPISRYEKNVFLQPAIIQETLERPIPRWVSELKNRRLFFVGIGSSYHAAQIAKFIWQEHVSANVHAVNSFDFAKTRQPILPSDAVVVFSHRGSKSCSVAAASIAKAARAMTVGVSCKGSPWQDLTHLVETCEAEDTGGFTKSLTCALAGIVRWVDEPGLTLSVKEAVAQINSSTSFPEIKADSDVVLIGDLTREWIAREIALKIQELAYLPSRAFGLEEFLHGPHISVGGNSVVIALSDPKEPRWNTALELLQKIGAPTHRVDGTWLSQLFWGQRLALGICKRYQINPDVIRSGEERYSLPTQ